MNNAKITKQVKSIMSKTRYAHTIRVTRLAIKIAKKVAPKLVKKVFVAAMYHDIGKEFGDKKIKQMIDKWDKKKYPTIHTLHGVVSALYVKYNFGIKDKAILKAIANHVVPPKNTDVLSMIIYCADKLEPARTSADISNRLYYVKLAQHNIKQCFDELRNEIMAKYN